MTASTNGNGNVIDEFEEVFQQCLSLFMINDGLHNSSLNLEITNNETAIEVEQATLRFIDLARQVEAFFLQKRFLLSALKPELMIKEELSDLKQELVRKDELIKRNCDKILMWQNLLAEIHSWVQPNGMSSSAPNISMHGHKRKSSLLSQSFQHQFIQHPQLYQTTLQHSTHQQISKTSDESSMTDQSKSVNSSSSFTTQTNLLDRTTSYSSSNISNSAFPGPLAFLEKTTSSIGMSERQS